MTARVAVDAGWATVLDAEHLLCRSSKLLDTREWARPEVRIGRAVLTEQETSSGPAPFESREQRARPAQECQSCPRPWLVGSSGEGRENLSGTRPKQAVDNSDDHFRRGKLRT